MRRISLILGYSPRNKIAGIIKTLIRSVRHGAQNEEIKYACNICVAKHQGKGQLQIYPHIWEDNIRFDLKIV